eukprot:2219541-Alexandrium_andersonii.AAC.1
MAGSSMSLLPWPRLRGPPWSALASPLAPRARRGRTSFSLPVRPSCSARTCEPRARPPFRPAGPSTSAFAAWAPPSACRRPGSRAPFCPGFLATHLEA